MNKVWIVNQNQNVTQVHLTRNNFKVLGEVKGTADVDYVLVFGGANKKQLYEAAYNNMLENAKLTEGSKTVTNILTEEHVGGVPPLYYTHTVTVTARVIEFTNDIFHQKKK